MSYAVFICDVSYGVVDKDLSLIVTRIFPMTLLSRMYSCAVVRHI